MVMEHFSGSTVMRLNEMLLGFIYNFEQFWEVKPAYYTTALEELRIVRL